MQTNPEKTIYLVFLLVSISINLSQTAFTSTGDYVDIMFESTMCRKKYTAVCVFSGYNIKILFLKFQAQ